MSDKNRLSQDQVAEIINNAPPGSAPEKIVRELANRGFILEGYNEPSRQEEVFGPLRDFPVKFPEAVLGGLTNISQSARGGLENFATKMADYEANQPPGSPTPYFERGLGLAAMTAREAFPESKTETGIELATSPFGMKPISAVAKLIGRPLAKGFAGLIKATANLSRWDSGVIAESPLKVGKALDLSGQLVEYKKFLKGKGAKGLDEVLKDTGIADPNSPAIKDNLQKAVTRLNEVERGVLKADDLTTTEIVFGRQAASRFMRLKENDDFAIQFYYDLKNRFGKILEARVPGIKNQHRKLELSYAKEAAKSILPQSRKGDPEIVRSLTMLGAALKSPITAPLSLSVGSPAGTRVVSAGTHGARKAVMKAGRRPAVPAALGAGLVGIMGKENEP